MQLTAGFAKRTQTSRGRTNQCPGPAMPCDVAACPYRIEPRPLNKKTGWRIRAAVNEGAGWRIGVSVPLPPALPGIFAASVSRQGPRPAHYTHYKQRCHQDDERPLRDSDPPHRTALSHRLNHQQERECRLDGRVPVVTRPPFDESPSLSRTQRPTLESPLGNASQVP